MDALLLWEIKAGITRKLNDILEEQLKPRFILRETDEFFNVVSCHISHLFFTRNIKADDLRSSWGTWSMNWTFIFQGAVLALPFSSPTYVPWDHQEAKFSSKLATLSSDKKISVYFASEKHFSFTVDSY